MRRSGVGINETIAADICGHLGTRFESQFREHVRHMELGGAHVNEELFSDLLVRSPLAQQGKHLALAPCELLRLHLAHPRPSSSGYSREEPVPKPVEIPATTA